MSQKKYIVALDQGTTSSRTVILDKDVNIVTVAQREFPQIYPKPGWVEHDPRQIWASQSSTLAEALAGCGITSEEIAAIGIIVAVLNQVLIRSGREEQAMMTTLAGLIVVLMILVATAGYFVFSGDNASEQSAGELKASVNGSEQLEPLDAAQPLVSGSLSMEGGNVVESNNTSTVVIEADSNKDAAPVEVVDANTARATAQAHALKQNELQAQREQQEADAAHGDQPDVLPLPQDSVISISNDAPEVQHNTLIEAPTNGAASDVVVNLSVEEQAKLAAQKANAAKRGDSTAIAAAATAEVEAKAKAQAAAEAKAKAEAAAKEAEAAEAKKVELSSNLRDISSQVKVQNRDGLASLNRAEINVKKDVALRVIDGSGKTLRSGTFKAGDTVQVNGIPPIRVQLSDTDAVSVSYMGGSINMPKREQVEFELPMR